MKNSVAWRRHQRIWRRMLIDNGIGVCMNQLASLLAASAA